MNELTGFALMFGLLAVIIGLLLFVAVLESKNTGSDR